MTELGKSFSKSMVTYMCNINTGTSRRMSDLQLSRSLQTEVKEKRLVDVYLIRAGMLRFSLLMSVSEPGSLPEPEFLAALLTLVSEPILWKFHTL